MDLDIRRAQIVNQPLFVWFQFYVVVQLPIVNNDKKNQFKIGLLCFLQTQRYVNNFFHESISFYSRK